MSDMFNLIHERAFPSFYKEYAPKLLEFFKAFVEHLEQDEQAGHIIDKLVENQNIDTAEEDYLLMLNSELMQGFPEVLTAELRILLKNISMMYRAKGSVASYEYFFNVFYDARVRISYPKDQMLKTSDGRWIQPTYIIPAEFTEYGDLSKYIRYRLVGSESGASGTVKDVQPFMFTGDLLPKLAMVITNVVGQFVADEEIVLTFTEFGVEPDEDTLTISIVEVGPGYYDGTSGLLDSDMVIQDSYYYQDFSYVLSSEIPISEYIDPVTRLIHPAGLKIFGTVTEDISKFIMDVPAVDFFRMWYLKFIQTMEMSTTSFIAGTDINMETQVQGKLRESVDTSLSNESYLLSDNFEDLQVQHFARSSNLSSFMIFDSSGNYIHDIDWNTLELPSTVNSNELLTVWRADAEKEYFERTIQSGNIILIKAEEYNSVVPGIFINGMKIASKDMTRTTSQYTLVGGSYTGQVASVVNPLSVVNTRYEFTTNTTHLTTDYFTISEQHLKKYHAIPFVNGYCWWNKMVLVGNKLYFTSVIPSGSFIEFLSLRRRSYNQVQSYRVPLNKKLYINNIKLNKYMP